MTDEIKVNRVNPQPVQPRPETASVAVEDKRNPMNNKTPWVILGVVLVILLAIGIIFRDKLFNSGSRSGISGTSTSKEQPYQAVFLTNGQVYFGKITGPSGDYLTLKDIWYLQVVQPQQPIQGQQPNQQQQQTQPQISLIKLGQELHGPVDEMHISKAQILFYEDLKNDGQVVKTILDEKAKQK